MHPSLSASTSVGKEKLPIQGLVPSIGPLHVSLNAQETVMQIFNEVFKHIYEQVFPHSKLADKPKPWRTSLILELAYGGWVMIRDDMIELAKTSRSIYSSMLINLFDNYLPLVLSIYAISFKLNKFKEYENAMVRIWTMFLNFKRRHYNKSPLVWLSQILYWQQNSSDLYSCVSSNIAAIDEYRVENTHSIITGNTNSSDNPEQLSRKAKALFAAKSSMFNFQSSFSPPKNYTFSRKELKHLKTKTSDVISELFVSIYDTSSATERKPSFLNPERPMDIRMLPLGYHTNHKPCSESICDWPGCCKGTSERIVVFDGCWHFFHVSCMPSICIICQSYLQDQLNSLGPVMWQGLFPCEDEVAEDEAEDEVVQQQLDDDNIQVANANVTDEEIKEKN